MIFWQCRWGPEIEWTQNSNRAFKNHFETLEASWSIPSCCTEKKPSKPVTSCFTDSWYAQTVRRISPLYSTWLQPFQSECSRGFWSLNEKAKICSRTPSNHFHRNFNASKLVERLHAYHFFRFRRMYVYLAYLYMMISWSLLLSVPRRALVQLICYNGFLLFANHLIVSPGLLASNISRTKQQRRYISGTLSIFRPQFIMMVGIYLMEE